LLCKSRAVRETPTPHRSRKVAAIAIYHASTKPLSRSAGRSAVAAAAYRAGEKLIDERTGLCHDYTRRDGVVLAEVITPDGGSAERSALWNAAEGAEKRKDARTAREWVVALPAELEAGQRGALACSFGVELALRYGVAVDVAVHQPDREGDNRNHHAHLLMTTRQVSRGADGMLQLGEKAGLELSDKKRRELGLGPAAEEVTAIRELWAGLANTALERAGKAQRIDARSLSAQGIDREATTHLGPVATEMERRGCSSDRGDGNRQAAANNASRRRLRADISDLKAEQKRRERERIARMSSQELAVEIEHQRPPSTAELLARDLDVLRAEREQARLVDAHKQEQHRERRAKDAAMRWRQKHPRRAKLHDMGIFRSSDLLEQAKIVEDAERTGCEVRQEVKKAELVVHQVRRDAERRITQEWEPVRLHVMELEQLRMEKAKQEQLAEKKRQEEQARCKVAERFDEMAKRRGEEANGYTDSSRQWRATPEPLRHLIDDYNRQPEQVKAAFLDGIRTKPEVSKQVADMLQQRQRTLDRSRPGLEM